MLGVGSSDQRDSRLAAELNAFKKSIPQYAAQLGVTSEQVAAQAADADYFNYLIALPEALATNHRRWSSWKLTVRDGSKEKTAPAPPPLALPDAPPAVAPGIESRFRTLVKEVRCSANYNPEIGKALGFADPGEIGPNFATLAPQLHVALGDMNIRISWNWSGYAQYLDQCELHVDRNDGRGAMVLAISSALGYVDTEQFPTTSAEWTYRAIYRSRGKQVGKWSKATTLLVSGK
jgi:hypothetical protein